MNRNSLTEISGRVMHMVQRFTLNMSNDNPMMQLLHLDGMNSEGRNSVERVQAFGFTSTPLPRDQQQQGQQGSGSTGGDGEQMKGPAAEGICLYVGGQRNHPVCIAIDDRRHRPMGLKPGENAQYDDLGQMTLLRRAGLFLLSLDGPDGSQQQSGGQGQSGGGQGQTVQRYVSVRHVQKQKQKRPQGNQSGQNSGSSSSGNGSSASTRDASSTQGQQGQQQDYKHEGDSVNNEMRVSAGRIEFRSGNTVVGYYDKQSSTWCFIGKVKLGSESAQHPVYGVNKGVGMTSDPNGSDAVLINATKPGPPTSLDQQP